MPGGFLKENETVEACVQRELVEETGLAGLDLKQFAVFSDPKRDSRGRVISIAYLAVIPNAERAQAGSDAAEAEWNFLHELPALAFDHNSIVEAAISWMKERLIALGPAGLDFVSEQFTLSQLQSTYRALTAQNMNKSNFRRLIARSLSLQPTGQANAEGDANAVGRPAELFRRIK